MGQSRYETETHTTRNLADEVLTQAVLATFDHSKSERFQQVMQSLVQHLHAFVTDVQLTEDEWFKGIEFLTRTGHITDEKRQEFILLSDVLGVSMLVIGLNHKNSVKATASTVFGPFFVGTLPLSRTETTSPMEPRVSHVSCMVACCLPRASRFPMRTSKSWQADDHGFYDVQQKEYAHVYGRGHLSSDAEGKYFFFWSVKLGRPTYSRGWTSRRAA